MFFMKYLAVDEKLMSGTQSSGYEPFHMQPLYQSEKWAEY